MTKKAKARKLVHGLVALSFTGDKLNQKKVREIYKSFLKLPPYQTLIYLKTYLVTLKKYIEFRSLVTSSSTKLSVSERASILKIFKKDFVIFKQIVNLDPSLLGGLRIKIGDVIFDHSVKGKIISLGQNILG